MLQRPSPHGQKSTALNVIIGIVALAHNAGDSASIGTPLPLVRFIHRSRILSAPSRHSTSHILSASILNTRTFPTLSMLFRQFALYSRICPPPPIRIFLSVACILPLPLPCFSNSPTPFTPSSLYFILYTLTSIWLNSTAATFILTITLPPVLITICLHTYILQANVPSVYPVPDSATNASTIV